MRNDWYCTNPQVDEISRVISVGDGIAGVYGLNSIQAGSMVEFSGGVKGLEVLDFLGKVIALNLENDNYGIMVFGSDTAIRGVKNSRLEERSPFRASGTE